MDEKSLYGFGEDCAQTYTETCKCGQVAEVSTQKDNCPEYKAEVWVKCSCGKGVLFTLPVN